MSHLCVIKKHYVERWSYICVKCGGGNSVAERKTLCKVLSLAPRLPAVYCRPSTPLGTEAALVRASGFRGAVGSFVCGRQTSGVCGARR
jgi:hypothetical protein